MSLSKVIMENPFDKEEIFRHFKIELEFTQESFDNPKVNKQLDDVVKHYIVYTLVENDKESCEKSKFIDEPVIKTVIEEGHPLQPPLDPGGGKRNGGIVVNQIINFWLWLTFKYN